MLVDEYQDLNSVQVDIVRSLCPDGRGLTVVGDDAQAIYGFRGADAQHLRDLAGLWPTTTVVRLERNFRSRQPILDLANVVRPADSAATPDPLQRPRRGATTHADPLPRRSHGIQGHRRRRPRSPWTGCRLARPGDPGPCRPPQRPRRGRALGPPHPVPQVRGSPLPRSRPRQGLHRHRPAPRQPVRRRWRGSGCCDSTRASARPGPGPWSPCSAPRPATSSRAGPKRRQRAGGDAHRPRLHARRAWLRRAPGSAAGPRAEAVLGVLAPLITARYGDAPVRLGDLDRLVGAAATVTDLRRLAGRAHARSPRLDRRPGGPTPSRRRLPVDLHHSFGQGSRVVDRAHSPRRSTGRSPRTWR